MNNTSLFKIASLLLISGITLQACKEDNKKSENDLAASSNMDSFIQFYQRFHQDSLYQIDHITFPLQGLPDNADSLTIALGNFRWKKENWKMQHPFDFEMSEFGREIKQVAPGNIEEIIYHKKYPYVIIRRFAYLGNDWYLIYYAGMNKIRTDE